MARKRGDFFHTVTWVAINLLLLFLLFIAIWKVVKVELRQLNTEQKQSEKIKRGQMICPLTYSAREGTLHRSPSSVFACRKGLAGEVPVRADWGCLGTLTGPNTTCLLSKRCNFPEFLTQSVCLNLPPLTVQTHGVGVIAKWTISS